MRSALCHGETTRPSHRGPRDPLHLRGIPPTGGSRTPPQLIMSNPGENLRVLAIFHFIVGGLYGLYIAFTGAMTGVMGYLTTLVPPSGPGSAPPPEVQKTIMLVTMGIGGGILFLALAYAGLTIWSGVCILRRRSRYFSLVMASVNLLAFPFGTALGIFAFILLRKEETVWWYAQLGSTVPGQESAETEIR